MDINDFSALFDQFNSAPGLRDRLQKQAALNAGMRAGKFYVDHGLSEHAHDVAAIRAKETALLPYQVGPGKGQVWPGDPNYIYNTELDPIMADAIHRYVSSLIYPSFKLPIAPDLQ